MADDDGSQRRKQIAKKSTGPPPSRVATRPRASPSGNFMTNAVAYADASSEENDDVDELASIANTGPADVYSSVRQSYQEAQVNWDPTVAENPVVRSANEIGHFGDSDVDSASEHESQHEGTVAIVPRDRAASFAPFRWIRRCEQEAVRSLRENNRFSRSAVSYRNSK